MLYHWYLDLLRLLKSNKISSYKFNSMVHILNSHQFSTLFYFKFLPVLFASDDIFWEAWKKTSKSFAFSFSISLEHNWLSKLTKWVSVWYEIERSSELFSSFKNGRFFLFPSLKLKQDVKLISESISMEKFLCLTFHT